MAKKKGTNKPASCRAVALLVSEGIGRGPGGKPTIYGVFDTLCPADLKEQSLIFVYAKIYGSGTHKFRIDVVDANDKSVMQADEELAFEHELQNGPLNVQVQVPVVFGKTGIFRIQLKAGRKLLSEYPITIAKQ